jgi:predicted O-linked N-acetylglucosamine transferase (SPINDLY family)
LHSLVDILLDTLPFSSGTTANFALWMGVPTLALAGDSMAQRLGAARMTAAGLETFVAESEEQYLDLAVAWSNKPDELAHLRGDLRRRMDEAASIQPALLTRALEQRLREMWQGWCAGLAPELLQ